jgi:hypothetical protein
MQMIEFDMIKSIQSVEMTGQVKRRAMELKLELPEVPCGSGMEEL